MTEPPSNEPDPSELAARAAGGDRAAAEALLTSIQDGIYKLALRVLGHPSDAEDATQEILVVVLTHLGSFRGESALRTWVWRIAARHLSRMKRGRRENLSFELLSERLETGLRSSSEPVNPESEVLAWEIRLRCTQAMLLSLDREHRLAYVLGDIFELSGEEAAEVLEIEPATFRKRLSRARSRLHGFMKAQCGVFDPANECRCQGQVACAIERGLLDPKQLDLSRHPARSRPDLGQAVHEVTGLMRVAEILRGHSEYTLPERTAKAIRDLLDSGRFALLER
jgi:RNA polymerase sigma factor (sigma-70 family)